MTLHNKINLEKTMITRTYYKNKKGQTGFIELDGLTLRSGLDSDIQIETFTDQNDIGIAFNGLIMKMIQNGFEFDRVETEETAEDIAAKTVDGVLLQDNQFIVDFNDPKSLQNTLENHYTNFFQYIEAIEGKGIFYGQVKDGKFVPHTVVSGDNELDFYQAAVKHESLRPLINELLTKIITNNTDEKTNMRDDSMPVGAVAAFVNAYNDKKYLVTYRRLQDSIIYLNRHKARFDFDGQKGNHIPQLLTKWGFDDNDEYAFTFLAAQLINIDNPNQAKETAYILNELGLAEKLKSREYLEKLYIAIAERAAHIFNQNDVEKRAGGEYLYVALNALGITCNKKDAYMVCYLMDDIRHYPSLAQLLAGNINEDDDFTPIEGVYDEENCDDEDDDWTDDGYDDDEEEDENEWEDDDDDK